MLYIYSIKIAAIAAVETIEAYQWQELPFHALKYSKMQCSNVSVTQYNNFLLMIFRLSYKYTVKDNLNIVKKNFFSYYTFITVHFIISVKNQLCYWL